MNGGKDMAEDVNALAPPHDADAPEEDISLMTRILAAAVHLGAFVACIGWIVFPVVVWIGARKNVFLSRHARQAFVAQVVVLVICTEIAICGDSFDALEPAVWIMVVFIVAPWFIMAVYGAIRAFDRHPYVYPFLRPFMIA